MKIAFLGAGKMATAFARGLVDSKVCAAGDIAVADASQVARSALASQLDVKAAESNEAAVAGADAVLLCVKPGDVAGALEQCGEALGDRLLISIVAGLSLEALGAMAGESVRVVRAMPNTAAQVGRSASAYAAGPGVTDADLALTKKIFSAVGVALPVPESQLDAVTGLSGSGPAYVYLVIEALSDGGVAAGLPRALASQLAVQTVLGAAAMVAETKEHPAVLREAVTSPGGTTAAGLGVLESAAVRSAFVEAVGAAADRSRGF
ncbi:MAG: pyrroline-5-carboxylate reductase [Chthoniobacterales bacterium]